MQCLCRAAFEIDPFHLAQQEILGAGREDLDPYWARPWPSAAALAEKIIAQPHLVRGCRVCDLGAGLGIAGIAAALAGWPNQSF